MFNKIKKIIDPLIKLYEIEYREIKPQVSYIIDNKIEDMKYIEPVLERLLNVPYDPCYKLFIKTCDYVSGFNKEIALEYLEIYKDMYGDNDIKKLVKGK